MTQENKVPIPLKLLLLDLIGVLLAGLGLANVFAGIDVIPEPYRFENYGLVFVVAGFTLTVPLISHVIKTGLANKSR